MFGLVLILLLGQLAEENINIFTKNAIHRNYEYRDCPDGSYYSFKWQFRLIEAGDATQGAFLLPSLKVRKKRMNTAAYIVMILGNHEFDYGVEQLEKNISLLFFIISANVLNDEKTSNCR